MKKNLLITLGFLLVFAQPVFGFDQEKILQEKYLPMFEEIEALAVTRLNKIIDEAYIEYEKKQANNEMTLPLLFSYIERGNRLEDEIDETFQALITSLKEEINLSGLPEDLAAPYEKQYLKSKRRNKLQILKNITLDGQTINFERKH